eukprot:TRINITY_DN32095_c0_g1_i1.p1 TRINITY_DN32095_c0_g1~~TRINITY_DN32095_c0_g1_i1.p1  ORF type:complete len:408 (-),score=71.70 TRINITY_DN32095_c0_g1_i1:23-1246(-)
MSPRGRRAASVFSAICIFVSCGILFWAPTFFAGSYRLHYLSKFRQQGFSAHAVDVVGSDTMTLSPGMTGIAVSFAALFAMVSFVGSRSPGYLSKGAVVLRESLSSGGSLQVTSIPVPPSEGDKQHCQEEWRVLRFERCIEYLQGVTRLRHSADKPGLQFLGRALSLPYNQSLVSVVLAALASLGVPVVRAASLPGRGDAPLLRFLCIGLGGGSVPTFFADALPGCSVDVVEMEPAVLSAAEEAMGFKQNSRLEVFLGDGAEFALKAASEQKPGSRRGLYDAIVIDAFDAEGNLPESMWRPGGGISQALGFGLLREAGIVAVNFLPGTNLEPRLGAYRRGISASGSTPGVGFSVTAEEGNLMAVQTCSKAIPPETFRVILEKGAEEVASHVACDFDMSKLATKNLTFW